MKFLKLKVGDVLIDEEHAGNDYILISKKGSRGKWLHIATGATTPHENLSGDIDDVSACFTVYRGRKLLQKGME